MHSLSLVSGTTRGKDRYTYLHHCLIVSLAAAQTSPSSSCLPSRLLKRRHTKHRQIIISLFKWRGCHSKTSNRTTTKQSLLQTVYVWASVSASVSVSVYKWFTCSTFTGNDQQGSSCLSSTCRGSVITLSVSPSWLILLLLSLSFCFLLLLIFSPCTSHARLHFVLWYILSFNLSASVYLLTCVLV